MTISRSDATLIRIVAAVIVDEQGRVLLVRKRGTDAFMLPGGKLAVGERALDALARELKEEIGCDLATPRPLGRFREAAANEPGSTVEAELFAVEAIGGVAPAAEIEEIRWHDSNEPVDFILAPLARTHVLPLVRAWKPA
ncbi:MAG TPA: NUDIX domain-containing protein [Allosphingosinicella sp.]|jgi:8-oxo-dGTP pyrophosphatase MutT (NUDIX family)